MPPAVEDLVVSALADPSIEPDLRRRGEREWSPRIIEAAAALAGSRVPAAIQHDDLHDANVVLNAPVPHETPTGQPAPANVLPAPGPGR
jgi:hypothetical protein